MQAYQQPVLVRTLMLGDFSCCSSQRSFSFLRICHHLKIMHQWHVTCFCLFFSMKLFLFYVCIVLLSSLFFKFIFFVYCTSITHQWYTQFTSLPLCHFLCPTYGSPHLWFCLLTFILTGLPIYCWFLNMPTAFCY